MCLEADRPVHYSTSTYQMGWMSSLISLNMCSSPSEAPEQYWTSWYTRPPFQSSKQGPRPFRLRSRGIASSYDRGRDGMPGFTSEREVCEGAHLISVFGLSPEEWPITGRTLCESIPYLACWSARLASRPCKKACWGWSGRRGSKRGTGPSLSEVTKADERDPEGHFRRGT